MLRGAANGRDTHTKSRCRVKPRRRRARTKGVDLLGHRLVRLVELLHVRLARAVAARRQRAPRMRLLLRRPHAHAHLHVVAARRARARSSHNGTAARSGRRRGRADHAAHAAMRPGFVTSSTHANVAASESKISAAPRRVLNFRI